VTAAYELSCATEKAKKDACVEKLPADVRDDCVTPLSGGDVLGYAKRMIAQACGS
jgi:hypothetical protein